MTFCSPPPYQKDPFWHFSNLAEWVKKGRRLTYFFSSNFYYFQGVFSSFFFINFCFYWITFYGHPVGDGEVGLSRNEIGNSKNQLICVFIFWYFKPLSTHRTSKFSLYKYIYIYLSPSELTQPRTSLYKGIYIYNNFPFTVTLLELRRWVYFSKRWRIQK